MELDVSKDMFFDLFQIFPNTNTFAKAPPFTLIWEFLNPNI